MTLIYMYYINTTYNAVHHHNDYMATGVLRHTHIKLRVGKARADPLFLHGCAKVHQLPQSHDDDEWDGMLIIKLYIFI